VKKALVLGPPGSGKSTISKLIGNKVGIPVIHLDQHFFGPNWSDPDREDFRQIVEELCNQSHWVMDGGYGSTLDHRLRQADTVIYLDESAWTCLKRVLIRTWKYYGKTRPSMAVDCPERFSLSFLHYVIIHNWVKRDAILQKLSLLDDSYHVHVLKGAAHQDKFLSEL